MGFYPLYILFSFQHATGPWTANPQGNFPSFVAFCSPTLHDKDIDLSDFYDHTRVSANLRASHCVATGLHTSPRSFLAPCRSVTQARGIARALHRKSSQAFFARQQENTSSYSRRVSVLKLLPAYLLSWFTYPSLSQCCLHDSIFSALIKTLRKQVGYQNSPQNVRTIACLDLI